MKLDWDMLIMEAALGVLIADYFVMRHKRKLDQASERARRELGRSHT